MCLQSLAEELLGSICDFLERDDLCRLRLSSQQFSRLTKPMIFKSIKVLRTVESVQRAQRILDVAELRTYVTAIELENHAVSSPSSRAESLAQSSPISAQDDIGLQSEGSTLHSEPDENTEESGSEEVDTDSELNSDHSDYQAADPPDELPDGWYTLIEQIRACSQLREATIHFPYLSDHRDSCTFWDEVFYAFMDSLVDAKGFRKLAIWNLQSDHSLSRFRELLSRLDRLHLLVSCAFDGGWDPTVPSLRTNRKYDLFGDELQHRWLGPLQEHLTSLSLWSDIVWVYHPFCDLRQIHFPSLKSLTLCRFGLAYDWQREWIFQHHKTLVKLYLETCSIVHITDSDANTTTCISKAGDRTHNAHWSDYFGRIEPSLPLLTKFIYIGDFLWAQENEIGDWRYVTYEDGWESRLLLGDNAPEDLALWDAEDNAALDRLTTKVVNRSQQVSYVAAGEARLCFAPGGKRSI